MIPLAAVNQLAAVYRGRGRNEAYLEFAKDHFLDWLRLEGLFEDDAVVFKEAGSRLVIRDGEMGFRTC